MLYRLLYRLLYRSRYRSCPRWARCSPGPPRARCRCPRATADRSDSQPCSHRCADDVSSLHGSHPGSHPAILAWQPSWQPSCHPCIGSSSPVCPASLLTCVHHSRWQCENIIAVCTTRSHSCVIAFASCSLMGTCFHGQARFCTSTVCLTFVCFWDCLQVEAMPVRWHAR